MLVDNSAFWAGVASEIISVITPDKTPYQFFDPYNLVSDNPLANVVSQLTDGFFGAKQLHFVIIGKPYGWIGGPGSWTFSWPPTGYADLKQFIIDNYDEWQKFKLVFFGDQYIINKVLDADPDSEFPDMMDQTFTQIQAEVAAMVDYGWEWGGLLGDTTNASTFTPYIDDFFT